jgi:hypothetical protein
VPGRQRGLVPVLIVVVSLTVGAGLLARELYRLPDESAAQTVTVPTTSALSPEEQPGPPMVELTPGAASHPAHESVRQLLQTHFDAINGRSYERWMTTVTADRIRVQPRREWLTAYRSTRDGSIIVRRIDRDPGERSAENRDRARRHHPGTLRLLTLALSRESDVRAHAR